MSTLLLHAPIQGKKIQESFVSYICDPAFAPAPTHVQATYYDRVRPGARRRMVSLAAKHALRELPVPPETGVGDRTVADRMAVALNAFADRDRDQACESLQEQMAQFATLTGEAQLRGLARLGDRDYFWEATDEAVRDLLRSLIEQPNPQSPEHLAAIALVRATIAREQLPQLNAAFDALNLAQRIDLMTAHPDAYFVPTVIEAVQQAPNWATGTALANGVLVPHANFFSSEDLKKVLDGWLANVDCLRAKGMPQAAAQMATLTAAKSTDYAAHWKSFLEGARKLDEPSGYYSYSELGVVLEA